MHHPTDRITHTTAFVTPVVEHWLEREIAQWDMKQLHILLVAKYGLSRDVNKELVAKEC